MPKRRVPRAEWQKKREPYERRTRNDQEASSSSSSTPPDFFIASEEDERDLESMAVAIDPNEVLSDLDSPVAINLEEVKCDVKSPGSEENNFVVAAVDVSPETFHDAEYFNEPMEDEYDDDNNLVTAEAKSVENISLRSIDAVENMPVEEQLVHSIEPVETTSAEIEAKKNNQAEMEECAKEVSENFKQMINEAKRKFMERPSISRRRLADLLGNVNGQY